MKRTPARHRVCHIFHTTSLCPARPGIVHRNLPPKAIAAAIAWAFLAIAWALAGGCSSTPEAGREPGQAPGDAATPAIAAQPSEHDAATVAPAPDAAPKTESPTTQPQHAEAPDPTHEVSDAPLDEGQQDRLQQLLAQMRDAKQPEAARREAVRILLSSGLRAAVDQLLAELRTPADALGRQLVLRELAETTRQPPGDFAPVLIDMLATAEEPALSETARALSRYTSTGLTRDLIALAHDGNNPLPLRRGAIAGLGQQRTQQSAGALVKLLADKEPAPVRQAAMSALAELTGHGEWGSDATAWQRWWAEARRLTREQWLARLTDNFVRRASRLALEQRQVRDRLVQLQQDLYRATPEDQREDMLARMLADPLAVVRQEAARVIEQRLVDSRRPGPELVVVLVARLDDPLPDLRRRSALLLENLADKAAAGRIAQRLAGQDETDPAVLRAYLLMMARLPQEPAVAPALTMLSDPSLRSEAAAALAAAAEQKLLNSEQVRDAAVRLREQLVLDEQAQPARAPEPSFVQLLGKVGDAEDWQRIVGWLDNGSDVVRRAAARAWAQSDRPLDMLAERAADPVIRVVVIEVARERGDRPQTLMALIRHRPEQDQAAESWRRALVAMAGRVPPAAVLPAVNELNTQANSVELCRQMLSAAIEAVDSAKPAEVDQAVVADLLLARADLRVSDGDAAAALSDYQRVGTMKVSLSPAQAQRRGLGLLRVHLAVNDSDSAVEVTRQLIGTGGQVTPGSPLGLDVARILLEAAARMAGAGQQPRSAALLAAVRDMLGQVLTPELRARLEEVEKAVAPIVRPAAGQGASTLPTVARPAPAVTPPPPAAPPVGPPAPAASTPAPPTTAPPTAPAQPPPQPPAQTQPAQTQPAQTQPNGP